MEKNYQLSSTIFHAIVSVKKETMYLADEIIGIQEKINMKQSREIFINDENLQKQKALKLTILQETINHYNEQISNINKHKFERNNNLTDKFVNLEKTPNLKNIIENEMEIDLEDKEDNIKINNNLNIIPNNKKIDKAQKEYILSSNDNNININRISNINNFSNIKTETLDINNNIVINNLKNENNVRIETEEMDHQGNNNINIINMDDTLSTEKSFEGSISSYSTEISNNIF